MYGDGCNATMTFFSGVCQPALSRQAIATVSWYRGPKKIKGPYVPSSPGPLNYTD
jgi:hypothetical protein